MNPGLEEFGLVLQIQTGAFIPDTANHPILLGHTSTQIRFPGSKYFTAFENRLSNAAAVATRSVHTGGTPTVEPKRH